MVHSPAVGPEALAGLSLLFESRSGGPYKMKFSWRYEDHGTGKYEN